MTAFYKGTVYECDYGRCKDDEGNPIWPGYKESWDVDLTALAPRATAALLAAQPLIVAVRDAARAAIVEVGTWAAYDICVAFKLIGPTTRPPLPPNYGMPSDKKWKKTLKPWPVFPRQSKRARH